MTYRFFFIVVVCFWFIYWFVNSPSKETGKEEQDANLKGHLFASHQLKERVVSLRVWRVTAPPLVLPHLKIWQSVQWFISIIIILMYVLSIGYRVWVDRWKWQHPSRFLGSVSDTAADWRPWSDRPAHWGTTSVFHSLLFQTYIFIFFTLLMWEAQE